ncbi:MAG: CHAT domain-containing protein [Bacteroidia bacterium]|nr:CHAT domain-containing protein [Bacteroidia bacterium]
MTSKGFHDRSYNIAKQGNIAEAIETLDSGIQYFSFPNDDEDSRTYCEVYKADGLKMLNLDSSLSYINTILTEYQSSKRTIPGYEGIFLVLKADVLNRTSSNRSKIKKVFLKAIALLSEPDSINNVFESQRILYLMLAYNGVSNLYYVQNRFDSSQIYLKRIIPNLDSTKYEYTAVLSNLAYTYSHTNACDTAFLLLNKAEDKVNENTLDKRNLITAYGQFARISYFCENYQESVRYSDSAIKYFKETNGDFLKSRVGFFAYKTKSHLQLGQIQQAVLSCREWLPLDRYKIVFESSLLSTDKKARYLSRKRTGRDEFFTTLEESNNRHPGFTETMLNHTLFLKQYTHHSYDQLQKGISENQDTAIKNLYNEWLSLREDYFGSLRFSTRSNQQLDSLKSAIASTEKKLAKGLRIELETNDYSTNSSSEISESLKKGEMALEFVRYKNVLTKKAMYAALVVSPQNNSSRFIPICSEDTLKNALKRETMESEFKYINRLYGSSELYNIIWSNLRGNYPEATRFYVSLSGLLNYVSHSALQTTDGQLFVDEVDLVIVHSSMNIEESTTISDTSEVFLLGGINYDVQSEDLKGTDATKNVYTKLRGQIAGNWQYLPETKKEVVGISDLWSKDRCTIFDSSTATEKNFSEYATQNQPGIIHIATHGFFVKKKSTSISAFHQYSYTHSGLVLTGANTCYTAKKSFENIGDGILTAPEISSLNLLKTKLVVLSACESGLGIYNQLGNSYGLKQGFRMAGVKNIVYSLWKVSDQTTREFMLIFYGRINAGLTIETAFSETRSILKKKYGVFDWGSFQLIQ